MRFYTGTEGELGSSEITHEKYEVVGLEGKLIVVLFCKECSLDRELFGDALFTTRLRGFNSSKVVCGCAKTPKWSECQNVVRLKRKIKQESLSFVGWEGVYKGSSTRVKMFCSTHGEWSSSCINDYLRYGISCPGCLGYRAGGLKLKDSVYIDRFMGHHHKDTTFRRCEALPYEKNSSSYWNVVCGKCGGSYTSRASYLEGGHKKCHCKQGNFRQKNLYILGLQNLKYETVAIKYGIANDTKIRIKEIQKSSHNLNPYLISNYTFICKNSCISTESMIKKSFGGNYLTKQDISDGHTETLPYKYLPELHKFMRGFECTLDKD